MIVMFDVAIFQKFAVTFLSNLVRERDGLSNYPAAGAVADPAPDYKTYFMLNSTEHAFFPANNC